MTDDLFEVGWKLLERRKGVSVDIMEYREYLDGLNSPDLVEFISDAMARYLTSILRRDALNE